MIRRPKAADTEEDLLAFQEKFISSGEKPSASVDAPRKLKIGSKRVQQTPEDAVSQAQARDVVDLQMEGEITKPSPKRSKFKEQRLKAKELKPAEDHHEIMDDQDTHITKILSEIQEHDTHGYTMPPPRYTRGGFPSVQVLEPPASVAMETSNPAVKKSLFAQQFDAHGLSYFGMESGGEETESERRDDPGKEELVKEKPNYSSLISGDGLVSVGVSLEAAKDEVAKIHEENVERLSSLSEEEIKKERERIHQQLDPNLLAFIKARQQQKQQLKTIARDHMSSDGDHMTSEQASNSTQHPPIAADLPSTQPLPPKLATPTSWVHMDVVEREKMEWMTDIDVQPSSGAVPGNKESNETRFSLEGLVIPRSIVLPDHLGLHHHGDEPQAAGYTLSELLSLCRSTVLQQRTFSLQLLSKIIQRARLNEYIGVNSEARDPGGASEASDPGGLGGSGDSVLQQLLAADVPLLLRYSLDESVGSVMFAAAACLHSLLVIPLENTVLEEYMLCHLGCVLPALRSPDVSHDQQTEETAVEVLHHDIILGYLKMKLLHRLRYILEVCAPPTPLPSHLLDVVTWITRHSLYAATEVFNTPRLMDVVFNQFLPLDWSADKEGVVDGKTCVSAMKLILTLCSVSRSITSSLLSRYKLSAVLVRYGVPRPSELGLPEEFSYPLSTTALLTWSVVLGYGLATEAFRDTYSELLKQLHSVCAVNSSPVEAGRDRALLCLVEAALCVAGISPDQLKMEGTSDTHPPPAINWSHARGFQPPLIDLSQQLSTAREDALCAGNVLHCLATLHSCPPPNVSPVDHLNEMGKLWEGPLSSLVDSSLFTQALTTLRDSSSLITPPHGSTSSPPSLHTHLTLPSPPKPALYGRPTMQPADYQSLVHPRLSSLAAAHLVWGYVRLIRESLHINKTIVSKVTVLAHNPLFLEYLKNTACSVESKVSTLDFLEIYLLYDIVKYLQSCMELNGSVPDGCGQLTFDLSHKLLQFLPPGMESLVWDLLSTVVLHSSLIGTESLFLEQDVTNLSLKDQPQPITFQDNVTVITSQLLVSSLNNLPTIQSNCLSALKEGGWCSMSKLIRSESVLCGHPLQASSKLLPPCHTHILPEDWVLLPIIQEYNRTTSSQRVAVDTADVSGRVVSMVTSSLQLLLLLEHLHPHLLARLLRSAKLSRLMCVFLIDNELFLEKVVHDLLSSLLSLYCREDGELDFSSPVPGLSSFVDLYSSLLEQFSAVSYGDHLFSCYLLLPLQQRFSCQLRRMVWGEHPDIIRVFSLPLAEVPVALENFLVPTETDLQLLEMYLSALSAQTVRSVWSPVFYLIAVHHVHNFIFRDGDSSEKRREKMLLRIIKMSNQEAKKDLLLYAGVSMASRNGLKLRDSLDERQSTIITSLLGTTDGVL